MSTELFQGITDALEPLVRRFDLRVVRKVRQGNYTEVLFSNATTGLSVAVDWAEFRPFLRVIRLEDGRMPLEHEPNVAGEARLTSFDVDDLLLLRSPSQGPVGKMLRERDDQAAARLIADYAEALLEHGTDVLSGDFEVFDELERIVKRRAAAMRDKR